MRPDLGILRTYLKRAGLIGEAELARQAATNAKAFRRLEEAIRSVKPHLPISPHAVEMEQVFVALFGGSVDLVTRRLQVGDPPRQAVLIFLDSMVDRTALQGTIDGLLSGHGPKPPDGGEELLEFLGQCKATVPGSGMVDQMPNAVNHLLNGQAILFLDGARKALRFSVPGWDKRAIVEPETEMAVRGPREGFIESLVTNASLLRRRIRDERLRIETMQVGEVTRTTVALTYIDGITKQSVVEEARRRIKRIKIDGPLGSNYIEELTEDTPYTVFPLYKATERPDSVAAALLEGRFAIIVEGSPFALIAPTFLIDMLQAPEDYFERYTTATALRFIRWMFTTLALLGPSFYVALTTYHQEILPTPLLLSILSAREGVPFPAVIEALIMEVSFEALREAGTRMPKNVGQAVNIVGALVIGQAAVQAGIVSAPMVIVVALTGIASFIVPKVSAGAAFRYLRFPMLLLAGTFGAFGITLGVLVLLLHLSSLRSFGAPYYAPLAPWLPADHDDVIFRAPHWANKKRPAASETSDPRRVGRRQAPGPQHGEEEPS